MNEKEARMSRLFETVPQNVDAVLVSSELNQRYFTDFPLADGLVLLLRNTQPVLFTDFRYAEAAEKAGLAPFIMDLTAQKQRPARVAELLKKADAHTLAYEDETMTCAEFAVWQDTLAGFALVGAGNVMENLRTFKSETEIGYITQAQRIAERALTELLPHITPDRTELELAAELEYRMRLHGAEGFAFDTIAISGTASSLPHGVPRDVKLERGFLTIDFGAKYHGYCSDMTRTFCIGKPTAEEKKIYETVLAAQTAVLDVIASGSDCGKMDGIARKIIDDAGYAGCFGHSLGHGVGMFVHEEPRLSAARFGAALLPGMVVTVEPGVYLAGKCGVRIEDMVAVTEEKTYDLTEFPKELMIL